MRNKHALLILAGTLILFSACQSKQTPSETSLAATSQTTLPPNVHKIVVEDVLQTSNYTYLQAKEGSTEQWLAVPTMQAKVGETYYYEGGLQMTKFQSKELNRTFETVLFLEKVSSDPTGTAKTATAQTAPDNASAAQAPVATDNQEQYKRQAPVEEKKDIKMKPAEGGITIAELYSKKESFAGKTVKIKGKVTKYTPEVMNKNWIHLQDGTESNGKFDFVVTSEGQAKLGDIITVEGKIGLNKDLGYGYFFDVIMEDAVIK